MTIPLLTVLPLNYFMFQAFADMVEGVYGGEGWVRLPDPPPPTTPSSQPQHTTGLLEKSIQKLESLIKIKHSFS
jgi:hypothetical protein